MLALKKFRQLVRWYERANEAVEESDTRNWLTPLRYSVQPFYGLLAGRLLNPLRASLLSARVAGFSFAGKRPLS